MFPDLIAQSNINLLILSFIAASSKRFGEYIFNVPKIMFGYGAIRNRNTGTPGTPKG